MSEYISKREMIERLRSARSIVEPCLGHLPVFLEPRVNSLCTELFNLQIMVERQDTTNTLSQDIPEEGNSNEL